MRAFTPACAGLVTAVTLVTLVTLAPAATGAAEAAHRDAVRDYLIVRHCALESDTVAAGFRIEVIELVGQGRISPRAARADRAAAADEVRRDWRNRGMGARDPRCLTVGRAAAERFLSVIEARE